MESSISAQGTSAGPEVLDRPKCRHEWLIDSPAGPSSRGVCAVCGEEREFQNYIEGSAWGYDVSVEQLSGGSRFPSGRQVPQDTDSEDE